MYSLVIFLRVQANGVYLPPSPTPRNVFAAFSTRSIMHSMGSEEASGDVAEFAARPGAASAAGAGAQNVYLSSP